MNVMQNISKKYVVAAVVIISLAFVVGGWLWYGKNYVVNKTLLKENNQKQFTSNENSNSSYKRVRISDRQIAFTFEVPSSWLVENRNMGEKPMTESEMREFLKTNRDNVEGSKNSDYTNQYSLEQIDKLSSQQLKDEFILSNRGDSLPNYPNASVSSSYWIYYGDNNSYQTDFYILSLQDAEKSWNLYAEGKLVKKITIDNRDAEIITNKNNSGKGSGSRQILIPLTASKTLFINKQYYPEGEVQEDFDHLLDTLKFE